MKKSILYVALGTGALLMIPLLLRFPWTLSDFIIGGVLLFTAGSLLALINHYVTGTRRKPVALALVVLLLLYLWAELAVGIFTNWGS